MHNIIIPESKLLKKHILSFNTLNKSETKNGLSYYAFPQRGISIGFFKQAQIEIDNNELIISKNENQKPKAILLGKFVNPLKITYTDFVEKISIHFTEVGIHYFFSNYFTTFAPESVQSIDLDVFNKDLKDVFLVDKTQQIQFLESFLLQQFQPIALDMVERAIALIWKNPSIQTKKMAQQLFVAEKTLNRQFQKYVGCTTSNFKRIVRFKKVMNDYFENPRKSLIKICYDNDYYDASHFYKQITQTTNLNPKLFFNKVQKKGLENHVYIIG